MLWVKPLGCGLVGAILGAALSGFIANECVTWYRISPREGGSSYFMLFIGLVGLAIGGILGLVTALLMGGDFGRQLLTIGGIVLGVAFTGWVAARAGGRVPPTLDGEEVILQVEIRCPAGWKASNRVRAGKNALRLISLNRSNVETASEPGRLEWANVRVEADRKIVPGDLPLYDSNSGHVILMNLGGENQGFELEMPAKPEPHHQQWSVWLPQVADGDSVAKGFRYRFRVQRVSEVKQALADRERAERERQHTLLAKLGSASPLADYLDLFVVDRTRAYDETFHAQVGEIIRLRAVELGPLLASAEYSRRALRAVTALNTVPESLAEPLAVALRVMLTQVQAYRGAYDSNDPDEVTAEQLRVQFEDWTQAWRRLSEASVPVELSELREEAGKLESRCPVSRIAARAGELLAKGNGIEK